jgi:dCMP deaminase
MYTDRDIDLIQRASVFAKLSPDTSRKTGCVIDCREVYGAHIPLLYGCNMFPNGVHVTPGRLERPAKYVFTEHAERNAIYLAASRGIKLYGATMYLSWYPCADCARAIVCCGIQRLVAVEPDWSEERYGLNDARQILLEGGVRVDFIPKETALKYVEGR